MPFGSQAGRKETQAEDLAHTKGSAWVSTVVSVDCACLYYPEISDRQIRHLFTKSLELTFLPTDDAEEDVVVKAASRREGTKTLRRRRSLLVSGTDRRKREIVQRNLLEVVHAASGC